MKFFCYLLIFFVISGCQTGYYRGPISDHFDGEKFYYPGEKDKKHSIVFFTIWKAILQNPWPKQLPEIRYATLPHYTQGIKVIFVNHSTVLMQSKQVNFLMDPIYSYRASPFAWFGPARFKKPGIEFIELPKIDVVLISHNHYDHLDLPTLKRLNKTFSPLFIVPLGNKILLNQNGIDNVVELDWWQQKKFKDATITFLPAHHSAQRWLTDRNRTLWGSFGIQVANKKIYFAGDTAYANHFKLIRQRWGKPDFSFIPIGAYEPREILKPYHLNPQEAVKSHLELGSHASMGIHWGTFQMSAEPIEKPVIDLEAARKEFHVAEKDFFVIREGEPFYVNQ